MNYWYSLPKLIYRLNAFSTKIWTGAKSQCMGIIKTGKVILKLIWEYKGPKRTKEVSKRKAVVHALICEKPRHFKAAATQAAWYWHADGQRPREGQRPRSPHQGFLVHSNGASHSGGERVALWLFMHQMAINYPQEGRRDDPCLTLYIKTSSISSTVPRVK